MYFWQCGDTILIHAAKGGHVDVCKALLKKYADVDVEGEVRLLRSQSTFEKTRVFLKKPTGSGFFGFFRVSSGFFGFFRVLLGFFKNDEFLHNDKQCGCDTAYSIQNLLVFFLSLQASK